MDSHASIVSISVVLLLVELRLSIDPVVSAEVTTEGRLSFGLIVSTSTHLATAAFLPYYSKSNLNERVILVIVRVR